MGLLDAGASPLSWAEAKVFAAYIKEHGLIQLINIFHRLKDRTGDRLLWGDEIEYMLVKINPDTKTAQLSLTGAAMLAQLQEMEKRESASANPGDLVTWHPEYASYMLEATPWAPYEGTLLDFLTVEHNMSTRRKQAQTVLPPNIHLMSITNFPRIGCPNFTDPIFPPKPSSSRSRSIFLPDEIINPHPRFPTLTADIRERRGSKVAINVPIYHDTNTPKPFVEQFVEPSPDALPDHIYMDAMGFGMGCCCLQVTFQACSLSEARYLYDQLAVVTPIFLALSAGAPIFRGLLGDVDCRWNVISASVDDRTRGERGLEPLADGEIRIRKSRYDSIDSYLGGNSHFCDHYNDLDLEYDKDVAAQLEKNGIPQLLSRHFAHLFIRDPLVVYKDLLEQDDSTSSGHFENIQSTNWQTMRFKPPPPESKIGWRVEFRPTEVQLTDFENAAYVVFVVLLTRAILSTSLNLYIPLSKVDENMQTAQQRDAARKGMFYFRKDLCGCLPEVCADDGDDHHGHHDHEHPTEEFTLMSADTIINGKEGVFVGLIPVIQAYLADVNPDLCSRVVINKYLSLISKRASGELQTSAAWMRDFVTSHPEYKHDSVVSDPIAFDLLSAIRDIGDGRVRCEKMVGPDRCADVCS